MSAKVIAHSIYEGGSPLFTLQLRYWLPIHAEAKTHRVLSIGGEEYIEFTQDESFMSDPKLSRNAASNRAIPTNKILAQVENDPAMPIFFGKNQPGMQAAVEVDDVEEAKRDWLICARDAAAHARRLMEKGWHKQTVNRLLMPFQWIDVIVTATDWDNFFELRDHEDAQPEIRALAKEMRAAMEASTPRLLQRGEWHLPYVTEHERQTLPLYVQKRISVARCARVSFLLHDGANPDVEKDLALYLRLVGARPLHASPTEHQATPDSFVLLNGKHAWDNPQFHGNLTGWVQHRKHIELELLD